LTARWLSAAQALTTFSWDTTKVADGSHTLQAKAYDAMGNIGASDLRSVTIKNPKAKQPGPTCNFAWPTDGSNHLDTFLIYVTTSNRCREGERDYRWQILLEGLVGAVLLHDYGRLPRWAKGSHTLVATAYNKAGVGGPSVKRNVILK